MVEQEHDRPAHRKKLSRRFQKIGEHPHEQKVTKIFRNWKRIGNRTFPRLIKHSGRSQWKKDMKLF